MGTTTDKLNKLMETKAAIKAALVEKGQNPSDVFSTYAGNIIAIKATLNGTALPKDVLKDRTFYNTDQNEKLTGTIETFTPQNEYTSNQTLETSGKYLSGNIIINTPVKKDEQIKTVELNMSTGNQVITPDPNKVLTEVTINKPDTFIKSNIKTGILIGGITGTFTNDADAVASDIIEGKTAYVNGVKITGTNTNEVNYSTLLTSTYPNRYSITTNLTGVTASASNPETIEDGSGALLTFTASDGYSLPDGVTLTNVTSYNWNKSTGALEISRPTGDVISVKKITLISKSSVSKGIYRFNKEPSQISNWSEGELVYTLEYNTPQLISMEQDYSYILQDTEFLQYITFSENGVEKFSVDSGEFSVNLTNSYTGIDGVVIIKADGTLLNTPAGKFLEENHTYSVTYKHD